MNRLVATVLALALLMAMVLFPESTLGAQGEEVVPAGVLRVALYTDHVTLTLVSKDPQTGELFGVGWDLAQALAAQLGVPLVPVEYANPGELFRTVNDDAWDIVFQNLEIARSAGMEPSPPYVLSDFTYVVRVESSIRSVADIDQAGLRIAVDGVNGNPADRFLRHTLKQAQLAHVGNDAFDWLAAARADAVAAGRDKALSIADEMPAFRVLEDNFMVAEVGIAVPKGHPALLAYVTEFVRQAQASGLVEQSIERLGLRGVRVAPDAAHAMKNAMISVPPVEPARAPAGAPQHRDEVLLVQAPRSPLEGASELILVADGFESLEGPQWVSSQGVLLFVDNRQDTIYQLSPPSDVAVFRRPAGRPLGLARRRARAIARRRGRPRYPDARRRHGRDDRRQRVTWATSVTQRPRGAIRRHDLLHLSTGRWSERGVPDRSRQLGRDDLGVWPSDRTQWTEWYRPVSRRDDPLCDLHQRGSDSCLRRSGRWVGRQRAHSHENGAEP